MMRKILLGLFGLIVVLAGAALFVTRNTPVSHPVLAQSDLPPLIPTRAFYASSRYAGDYVAHSDGTLVVYEQATLLGRSWRVIEVQSGTERATFPLGLRNIRWHPTEYKLRFEYDGHDWEADIASPEEEDWRLVSPVRLSGGWNKLSVARNPEDPVIAWGKTHQREVGHLWAVSQDGLTADKIAEGSPNTQYWVLDTERSPVLRIEALDDFSETVQRMGADGFEPLMDVDLNDTFVVMGLVQKDGTVLARSSRGRDKIALVRFDVATTEETVVVAPGDSDVGYPVYLTFEGEPDLVERGTNALDYVSLSPKGDVLLKALERFGPDYTLGRVSPTSSGRMVTVGVAPAGESFVYLLIDLETGDTQELGQFHFGRYNDRLVPHALVQFPARDGLTLHGILTMPQDPAGPIPFVVYVHGGPAGQDYPGYSHMFQFLVNRGYGVLSLNFRGSTGFGKEFQAAGFREFGRAMQDDVSDAALWLVDQGLADTDALAVMGASYGGYAAAMAMSQDPGLFDAGLVMYPMLDAEFQSRYHPGFWEQGLNGWWRYFGKPDVEEDLDLMRQYSPINRIDDLHGPIQIIAGVRDEITAVQQVRDYMGKAEAADKDVAVHYLANAGHGAQHWRDQLTQARVIEDFLARTLGGRSGGFDPVELAPEFID